MVKGHLVRNLRTGQFYIEVTFTPKYKECLFHDIVEHCAKSLSVNELKTAYNDCNEQLLKMDPNDVPQNFHELMNELSQAIINRKAYAEPLVSSVQSNQEEKKQ